MLNDYDGVQHDFTRKKGLIWQDVFLPEFAPPEWKDRSVLWNAVEKNEKTKDSRLAREFVRKVQSLRKEADFVITDHIIVTYHGSDAIKAMLDKYYDYVMGEVLGDKLVVDESMSFDDKLNEEDVAIQVERV